MTTHSFLVALCGSAMWSLVISTMTMTMTLSSFSTTSVCVSAFVVGPSSSLSRRVYQYSSSTRLFETEVGIDEIQLDVEERMEKSIESVKRNLQSIRTGRASPAILDRVKVDYYGVETPINQMATISVPSAQQLSIDPYDKSTAGAIEKAISEADLGLTCNNDGNLIRINIPQLTEERRKDMLKQCKAIGEEGKVALRNIRRDGVDTIKKMEKKGEVSEDQMKDGLDQIQKITDKGVKNIENIVASKEKEVMTV